MGQRKRRVAVTSTVRSTKNRAVLNSSSTSVHTQDAVEWKTRRAPRPPAKKKPPTDRPSRDPSSERTSRPGDRKFDPALLKSLSYVGSDTDLARSQFWIKYEETASDFDKQLVSRLENDVDISMLFAGLFSAVNTAFIIAMQSSIVVVDSSNAAIANATSSSPAWTTTLAYASLCTSLLAAFGTLLAKQWLAQFKATRSTHGSLSSRGIHRQRKFDGLQNWHFNAVLDCFPLLLQGSLLLFAVSLLGNTWHPSHDVAHVVLAATGAGVALYLVTFFVAILLPDSPFQTPPSRLTRLLLKSLSRLPLLVSHTEAQLALLPRRLRTSSLPTHSKFISLPVSTPSEETPAVRWLLQISTDPAVVTAVATMVPEVDWPVNFGVRDVAKPLWATFKGCFKVESDDYNAVSLSCSDANRSYACGKALFHLYSQALYGDLKADSRLRDNLALFKLYLSSAKDLDDPQEYNFAFICDLISLITRDSTTTPSISVPEGELSWVSHIIPAFLHNANDDRQAWVDLAASTIPKFARYEPVVSKVLANYWVIIALIIGIQIHRRDLVKTDKSPAITHIREEVCGFFKAGSTRLAAAIQARNTSAFPLALDLILRVLSVEQDRGMISEDYIHNWMAGLYESLITGGTDNAWKNDGSTIMEVVFGTLESHPIVKGKGVQRSGRNICHVLKDSVASSNAEVVGLVLPLWLNDSEESVDYDLCIDAITLLLGCDSPRFCRIAFHSVTQVLGSSSRHSLGFLRCDESKLALFFDTLLDPSRMTEEDRVNIAISYLQVVSTMADNPSFHHHLLTHGHVQRCINIQLNTRALVADKAETLRREHSFLLLEIIASIGTCFDHGCIEAAVHPSATIVKDYPLEWQTIISALQYIQNALRHQLNANRITHIANYIESICRPPHYVPLALREAIGAKIHRTHRSSLDSALDQLVHVLNSTHAPPALSAWSPTAGSRTGTTSD